MIRFWVFLHLLGFTMWLGGGLAVMVAGIASRREERVGVGAVALAQGAVYQVIIGPCALPAVLAGLMLTFAVSGRMGELVGFIIGLLIMQGPWVLGALVVLLIGLPTAAKLSRLDPMGPGSGYFAELRQRQRVGGSVSGTLALLALVAGALVR